MGNTSEYNAKYYAKNRKKISAARRRKYLEDPEFAEQNRKRAREGMRKRRAKERAERTPEGRRSRNRCAPKPVNIDVGQGKYVETDMYTVGALAAKLHRSVKTIYHWEKKEVIPKAMFRDAANRRMYTKDQVDMLCDVLTAVEKEIALEVGMKFVARVRLTKLRAGFQMGWKAMPNGLVEGAHEIKESKNA